MTALLCTQLKINDAGTLSVDKVKTDLGGGDCIDSEDCNNYGVCKTVPKQKGSCCCAVGYSGRHCGIKAKDTVKPFLSKNFFLSKDSVKPLAVIQAKMGRTVSYNSGKRANVISSDLKRKLDYEPSSNIYGLTPNALAEADYPFVIYNPDKRVYLFVSHDLREIGKSFPYTEARDDKFGSRNIFKLIRVPGFKDKFYIHCLDQNKYLHVSQSSKGTVKYWNANLLAASEIPGNAGDKEGFIFKFDDDDGDGLFTIRNRNKLVYVSEHSVGNPPSKLVKLAPKTELDRFDSKYFQFALKDKVTNIEFKVTGKRTPLFAPLTMIDGAQTRKICYKGTVGDVKTQATNLEYVEELTDIREYTKPEGFLFNTATTEFKDLYGTELFTHSSSETETIFKANIRSMTLNITVDKCACVWITFKNMRYQQPYEFQARTKENNTIRSKGFIIGERNSDFQVIKESSDYREFFKCPHET